MASLIYQQERGRKRNVIRVDHEAYVILHALSLKNKVPVCDIIDELLVRSGLKSEDIIRTSTRDNVIEKKEEVMAP